VNECIHGLEDEQCSQCGERLRRASDVEGTMAGKSFALVFAPSLRDDTFLHLNREGDHWKIRWYSSSNRPANELAQSGQASTRLVVALSEIEFVHEISYPYSTSPGGVTITDHRYWFDEIAKVNAKHNIGVPAGAHPKAE
jgi:hypothetical protein